MIKKPDVKGGQAVSAIMTHQEHTFAQENYSKKKYHMSEDNPENDQTEEEKERIRQIKLKERVRGTYNPLLQGGKQKRSSNANSSEDGQTQPQAVNTINPNSKRIPRNKRSSRRDTTNIFENGSFIRRSDDGEGENNANDSFGGSELQTSAKFGEVPEHENDAKKQSQVIDIQQSFDGKSVPTKVDEQADFSSAKQKEKGSNNKNNNIYETPRQNDFGKKKNPQQYDISSDDQVDYVITPDDGQSTEGKIAGGKPPSKAANANTKKPAKNSEDYSKQADSKDTNKFAFELKKPKDVEYSVDGYSVATRQGGDSRQRNAPAEPVEKFEDYEESVDDKEEYNEEIAALARSSEEIKNEIQNLKEALASDHQEKSRLYSILDEKEKEIEFLRKQVRMLKNQIEEALVENKELKKDRRAINSELSKLVTRLNADEIEIHDLKEKLEDLISDRNEDIKRKKTQEKILSTGNKEAKEQQKDPKFQDIASDKRGRNARNVTKNINAPNKNNDNYDEDEEDGVEYDNDDEIEFEADIVNRSRPNKNNRRNDRGRNVGNGNYADDEEQEDPNQEAEEEENYGFEENEDDQDQENYNDNGYTEDENDEEEIDPVTGLSIRNQGKFRRTIDQRDFEDDGEYGYNDQNDDQDQDRDQQDGEEEYEFEEEMEYQEEGEEENIDGDNQGQEEEVNEEEEYYEDEGEEEFEQIEYEDEEEIEVDHHNKIDPNNRSTDRFRANKPVDTIRYHRADYNDDEHNDEDDEINYQRGGRSEIMNPTQGERKMNANQRVPNIDIETVVDARENQRSTDTQPKGDSSKLRNPPSRPKQQAYDQQKAGDNNNKKQSLDSTIPINVKVTGVGAPNRPGENQKSVTGFGSELQQGELKDSTYSPALSTLNFDELKSK